MTRREIFVVTLIAAAIASVWVWRVYSADRSDSAPEPEASASYYPDDAVAYVWLTLAPEGDQSGNLMTLVDGFDELAGVRGLVGEGEGMLPDAIGSALEDLGTWIGTEMSAAVVDLDGGDIGVAVTVGVRDRDAAGRFLQSWLEEQRTSISFERQVVDDGVIWVGGGNEWMEHQVYAQAGDLLLFATDRGLMEGILERVGGGHGETLATDERFMEARAAARDGRFASAYVDLGWLVGRMGDPDRSSCSGSSFGRPEWLMVSADWVDNGLVIDLVTPDVTSWWTDTSADVTDAVVPANALGFVSIGFDPDMDRWREVLGKCELPGLIPGGDLFGPPLGEGAGRLDDGATLADALDLALGFVDLGTGLDLEADLFDHLGGQFVLAAHSPAGEDSFIEGVAALSYRPWSGISLAGTLDNLSSGIGSLTGASMRQVDVGAAGPGRITEDGGPFSFGYVLHDGFLTFGTSVEALETTVAVQGGRWDRLSNDDEYQQTVGHIPYDLLLLAYVEVARVIDLVGASGMGSDDGLFGMLARWLGPMALGVGTDGDYSRATFVLPLRPFMDPVTANVDGR